MSPVSDLLEERIRERAYYIWEANGRPSGRDKEFWHQACEAMATDPAARPRRATRAAAPRKRSRKAQR